MPALVQDYMNATPQVLRPEDGASALFDLLKTHKITGAPVVDASGKLVGVVSVTDLIAYEVLGSKGGSSLSEEEDSLLSSLDIRYFREKTVGEMMSKQTRGVSAGSTIQEAAQQMFRFGVHRLIVTDARNRVEGILSTLDITRAAADSSCAIPLSQIMSRKPVVWVSSQDSAKVALQRLQSARVTAVLVLENQHPVGFVSQPELVEALGHMDEVKIGELLSRKLLEIDARTTVSEAAATMLKEGLRRLIVVERGKPAGIVTSTDITRAMSLEESA